jgi:23S rRNA (guanine745-N1)-methyltransferase
VLDAGCGEGFYTSALAQVAREKGGGTAGIDISKFAVRAAAGRYKGIDFAVASLFHIPCAAESADVLTDVFAPIVPAEFRRVLKPGGVMILAVPGARHLYGMKEVLYAAPYENEERDTDYEGFAFLGSESVRREITVEGAENIEALFSMTPYYWKTDVAGGERLRRLDTLQTEIKFRFLVYRRL